MSSKQSIIPEPIDDEKVKEILKLSDEGRLTQAGIASEVGVSRATVGKYIRERKRQLAPKVLRRFADGDIQSLCEILAPMLSEKLRGTKPSDSEAEGEDHKEESKNNKEEEKMSDEDLTGKMQVLLERQRQQEKMASDLAGLRDDIKTLMDRGERVPEKLIQRIDQLDGRLEVVSKEAKSFCEKFPQLCQVQERIEKKLIQIENSKPKGVLATDLKLDELLKDEKSQRVLAEKYLGPAGLMRALELCTGSECAEIRRIAKEKGIKLQRKRQGGGMLGGDWEDLDHE